MNTKTIGGDSSASAGQSSTDSAVSVAGEIAIRYARALGSLDGSVVVALQVLGPSSDPAVIEARRILSNALAQSRMVAP